MSLLTINDLLCIIDVILNERDTMKKTDKKRDIVLVLCTVFVCASIAGLVIFHLVSVKNAELRGYENGINAVKATFEKTLAK